MVAIPGLPAFQPIELHPLTPQIILGLAALALLGVDSVRPDLRQNGPLAGIAVAGAAASAFVAVWFLLADVGPLTSFRGAILVDSATLLFVLLIAVVTLLVSIASYDYVEAEPHVGEFYALILLAATGMGLMAAANSLATAFVALELSSLPSYALVAYLKRNRGSVEAGLKYFLVGALSSAVLAYGISLVYIVAGGLEFGTVASAIAGTELVGLLGVGVVMIVGGVAFKTASVPFHFWAPEAYEGAPSPISAFLSSASKAAGFVLAFRIFTAAFPLETLVAVGVDWAAIFAALAAITMTLGNFAAARQETVKRMLAYSSVGHAGYVLVGLGALGGGADDLVLGAAMTHLVVYGFMNTGAFLFVALAEYWGVGRTYEDYHGLAREAPMACLAMTIFVFSLAGLPVGGGFLSKYLIIFGAVSAGYAWLAVFVLVNSALSLYFYARVVKAIWIEEPPSDRTIYRRPYGIYGAIMAAMVGTVALLIWFDPLAQTALDAATTLL